MIFYICTIYSKPPKHSLGPLMSTFRSPVPAFLVSTLKSPACFTLIPADCRPRPDALQAAGTQAAEPAQSSREADGAPSNVLRGLKGLTRSDVHAKRALGDAHASKGDGDGVRPGLIGPVSAVVNTLTYVLHCDLDAVLAALWISDHGGYVSCSSPCKHPITLSNFELIFGSS